MAFVQPHSCFLGDDTQLLGYESNQLQCKPAAKNVNSCHGIHNNPNASKVVYARSRVKVPSGLRSQAHRFNLAIILSCKLVDQRSNHAAWPTPGRPEVNQYRYWRFQHLFLKRVIVHGGRCTTGMYNQPHYRNP